MHFANKTLWAQFKEVCSDRKRLRQDEPEHTRVKLSSLSVPKNTSVGSLVLKLQLVACNCHIYPDLPSQSLPWFVF